MVAHTYADSVLSQVLRDLEHETLATNDILDIESVKNSGKLVAVEGHVDDGTNDSLVKSQYSEVSCCMRSDDCSRRRPTLT